MPRTQKVAQGIPTIDVSMVVIRTGTEDSGMEIAIDTSSKIGVQPQIETKDPVRLVVDGRLIAQKPEESTITGHQIIWTDNVFTPDVVKILQGGQVSGSDDSLTYQPPVAGSKEKGEVFEMDVYSAQYDASGQIVNYEKTTYPNCQGTPIAMSSENGVFRVSEYTINSAPKTGEPPYKISYTKKLPTFSEVMAMSNDVQPETGLTV